MNLSTMAAAGLSRSGFRATVIAVALGMALPMHSEAASQTPDAADLTDLSIEQLLNVEVSSAGRKPQKLEDTATAIHVITQEDIRHSGMTSIPELLRMVPGLQVAQIDASTWAIGSRGFNGRYSNKLLVLLDGRTLYTPSFSGVYWDAQDVVLEDIERIEVIRGPGGTLWGSNAVNGVINITTKSAAATRGGMVHAGVGNDERHGMVRYGGSIGENGHFRVYAKNADYDNLRLASGAQAHDRWTMGSAGFRADWTLDDGQSLMAQGSAYDSNADHRGTDTLLIPAAVVPLDFNTLLRGGNLVVNWKRPTSDHSEWSFNFYYDTYQRRDVQSGEQRDTFDLDFQHRLQLGGNHDVVWGGGWRQTSDNTDAKFLISFAPQNLRDNLVNLFVQDEIALADDRLHLILGSKFERNEHTGIEVQPNLRLHWKMDERQSAWTAVSRAVHIPARDTLGISINAAAFPGPTLMRIMGNPALQPESVLAYEAGYRVRPSEQTSLDVAAFYNEYRNLFTSEPGTPFFEAGIPPRLVLPQLMQNRARGTSHGVELSGSWQPTEQWLLKGGYSWLTMNIRRDPGSADTQITLKNGSSPRHQVQLQARYAFDSKTDLNTALYYVDRLPSQNVAAYTRLDVRWGWRPRRDLELSLAARNLLDSGHSEYVAIEGGMTSSEMPRSVYGAATWRF